MRRYLRRLSAIAALLACPAVVLAGFAGTDVFLPMAGRQAGAHPSNWYTTVWIHNPGTEAVTATVHFLQRNTVNLPPPAVEVLVAPGATEKIENVVESLFHVQAFGALRVTSPTGKLVVTSRVYSKALGEGESDSVGQDFAGVPAAFAIAAGEKTQVLGVHQTLPSADSDFRFNFGFVETTGHSATVRVRAMDEAGTVQGFSDIQVREFSQRQVAFKDHFPTLSTDNMQLDVEVISGTGKVIAYGSAIANGSQDPTTFEMTYDDALLGATAVQHDDTLVGDGTAGAPLGIADGGVGADQLPAQVVTAEKLADAAVTVHKLATVPPPLPGPLQVEALRDIPLEAFFKNGEEMFWAPAFIGDITTIITDPDSGLTGGTTIGDADIAIAPLGVTAGMLADRSVTATKIDATPPSGTDPLKLEWSPTTGQIFWGPNFDSICPKGFMCGSTTVPVYRVTNEATGIALQGDAVAGTGVRGETSSGVGVAAVAAGGTAVSATNTGLSGNAGQFESLENKNPQPAVVAVHHGMGAAVQGTHESTEHRGVLGGAGYGAYGSKTNGAWGYLGGQAGAYGRYAPTTGPEGFLGTLDTGVKGVTTNGNYGVHGSTTLNWGALGTTGYGPYPISAVIGYDNSSNALGYLASSHLGVFGRSGTGYEGKLGTSSQGAYGVHNASGNHGYLGSDTYGALGRRGDDSAVGYLAGDHGVYGRCNVGGARYAGYFNGPVATTSLAGSGNRDVYADSNGKLIISTSDARLKTGVVDLSAQIDVLAALGRLRGVTFTWDTSVERAQGLGNQREIGMIAQEVEAVLPEIVGEGADGYKSLDYARLTAFLIEVDKAHQAQIAELTERVRQLEALAASRQPR